MSEREDQTSRANEFARKNFGSEPDEAAAAMGLRVLDSDDGGDEDGRSVPWVELPGKGSRDMADFAKDLGQVLASAPLFRREDLLVTVKPQTGELLLMTPERFLTWVADYAVIYEAVEVGRKPNTQVMRIRKTMPVTTARATLASDRVSQRVREIVRVNGVRMPVMRRDGRVELLAEGYDAETGIFTLRSEVKINEGMKIEEAVKVLRDYYADFTWGDIDAEGGEPRSLSVAIAAGVALNVMGLQEVEAPRMGFMFRANAQGGGKSLLAQMAIAPSFGSPKSTPRAQDDEMRKELAAVTLQGTSYLFMDNLKGHFESALLEGFMTSAVWGGRVMGTQRTFEAKKSTMLLVTGNNLSVSPDLQRRMLQCDLFIEAFDIQERRHKRELNPQVLTRPSVRGDFLSAFWAMIRHWDSLERPKAGPEGDPYRVASFADWSDIVGGIVQAAGFGNPLVRPAGDQRADTKTTHQMTLVDQLAGALSAETAVMEYKFEELIDCCMENELFPHMIEGRQKPASSGEDPKFELNARSSSRMGKMFTEEMAGKLGRVYALPDGRRVRFLKDGEGRAKRYRVELATLRSE